MGTATGAPEHPDYPLYVSCREELLSNEEYLQVAQLWFSKSVQVGLKPEELIAAICAVESYDRHVL
jgi:hypothetical protein